MRKYDMSLVDWISAALHRSSLDLILDTIRRNKRLKKDSIQNFEANKRYMEKILREEVIKQFNDSRRPILEVILNSIDARPKSEMEYIVNVTMTCNRVVIEDNGTSLDLEQILKLLIIPFNTEKEGIEEIGRFGVGFLSNFYYCVNNICTHVVVKTKTSSERYLIDFYCIDGTVAGLRMRLTRLRGKGKEGTRVEVQYLTYDRFDTKEYLKNHLSGIPSYMAKVLINDKQQNDLQGGEWYVKPVTLHIRGKDIIQEVGVRITTEGRVNLTSQGVLVQKRHFESDANTGAIISFPAAVKVVEGRDEFKIDDNYFRCAAAALEAFELCIKDHGLDDVFVFDMAGLFPELLAALSINDINTVSNLKQIQSVLLPEKKYVLTKRQYAILHPFLGVSLEKVAFQATAQACSFWLELYKPKEQLVEELMPSIDSAVNGAFQDRSFAFRNLQRLTKEIYGFNALAYTHLVNVKNHGYNCVAILPGDHHFDIYINVAHPAVHETHTLNAYQVLSDYFHLPFITKCYKNITKLDDCEAALQNSIPQIVQC